MKMDRKTLNYYLPVAVYIGLTVAGIVVIALAKLAGLSPAMTMLIPLVPMLIYMGLSFFFRRIQLHDEQTGDNLYYMGFLFTLTSLGASLYQFTSDGTMDDVVRNFGVAISSTIFGIMCRIFYNQTRRDVQDIERATRHDLATMARLVRAEMESARQEFAEFRRINNQMVTEGFLAITQQAEEASKRLFDTVEKMSTDAVKPVQNATFRLGQAINESTAGITDKLESIAKMLETSMAKIEDTAKRLESVQLPSEVIKNELAPVIQDIGQVFKDLEEKLKEERTEQNQTVMTLADRFTASLNENGKLVSDVAAKVEAIVSEQEKLASSITAKFEESRQDQNKTTRSVTDAAAELVSQLKSSVEHMARIIKASDEAVHKSEEVVKNSEETAQKSKETVASIADLVGKHQKVLKKVEAIAEKTEELDQKVEKASNEIRGLGDILNRLFARSGFGRSNEHAESNGLEVQKAYEPSASESTSAMTISSEAEITGADTR